MSKKIWLALILILTLSTVMALTLYYTRNWVHQASNAQPNQINYDANNAISIEAKLKDFVKDMSPYSRGQDEEVRRELLFTLQVFEQLEPADQRLIIGLKPEDVTNHQLGELQSIRSFLTYYTNTREINVYAFTSEKYRPFFNRLAGDSIPTPDRAITARKRIRQLVDGLMTLRKRALSIPYTDVDDRLHFFEMLRELASENYSDAKFMAEPMLPLFNDREGRLISLVEKWLNSSHAQKAIPIDRFERLYLEGKVQAFNPAFGSYLDRIKARISEERANAKESQRAASEHFSHAYSDIETFFESIAQLSAP
jgi:hypothetical protein